MLIKRHDVLEIIEQVIDPGDEGDAVILPVGHKVTIRRQSKVAHDRSCRLNVGSFGLNGFETAHFASGLTEA